LSRSRAANAVLIQGNPPLQAFIKKAVDDMIQERKLLGADEVNLVGDVKDRKDVLTVLGALIKNRDTSALTGAFQ
jgi:hypothetical protein